MARKKKKRKMFKPKGKYDFDEVEKICDNYGAKLLIDEFTFSIKFKDGKELVYALPYDCNRSLLKYILSDAINRGRIFKDDKFIGYAPARKSLDEILVNVDMIV